MADPSILVVTQVPDHTIASTLARALLEQRLAACVTIGAPVESIYHWRGRIESAREIPVTIKTRSVLYSHVEAAIRKVHPYDTPEILAIPVVDADARYVAWIAQETTAG